MLAKDTYCIDVITQTSAVKQALSGVEDALMESHLNTCVVPHMQKGKQGGAMSEILKVYRLKRKYYEYDTNLSNTGHALRFLCEHY